MLNKYEKGTSEPPFTAMAALCKAANVRLEWLATGEGEMHHSTGNRMVRDDPAQPASAGGSQPLRQQDLTMALQLAAEALGDRVLPPAKHAELVILIYELLEEGLPEAKVLRFARAAA